MLKEFKIFLMRGNVVDLAVGIIIGASFGKIVSSFVTDVLTPVLGLAMGKVDFSNLFIVLNGFNGPSFPTLTAAKAAGVATLNYGLFLNAVIDFAIVGFVIFLIVKLFNKLQSQPAPVQPNTKECPECLTVINLRAKRCPACTASLAK